MNRKVNSVCQECVFAVNDNNPHCGLRGFRNDFNVKYCSAKNNVIPNGFELQSDGYFSWVNKKKYPKTYKECCEILGVDPNNYLTIKNRYCYDGEEEMINYERVLLGKFDSLWKLIICRDAYWKIAGEEMGLGKPWEPENPTKHYIFTIENYDGAIKNAITSNWRNRILVFPTEEMRDAFYENFKELIENCKEFL